MGAARARSQWSPADADARINEWLLLRHAIAHGEAVLPPVRAVRAVRERPEDPPPNPALRHVDARNGLAFFRRLVRLTTTGLASHLGIAVPHMR